MLMSTVQRLGALALSCAVAAAAHADPGAFFTYGASYRAFTPPPVGAGSFGVAGDNLPDGRLVFVTGLDVYVETAPRSGGFTLGATLDPALVGGPAIDPAFLTINPSGSKIALGAGFGKPVLIFDSALATSGGPINAGNAASFNVNHFSAAWRNDTELAIGAGVFGSPSFVSLLDTTSSPAAPINPVIISNIGGASGGVAFDASGRLFTGNGFDAAPGGSGSGWIKAFEPSDWLGGPADFEAGGAFIVDSLSASGMSFDPFGNLFVGGGDFAGADTGAVSVFSAEALALALIGGSIDQGDMQQARRLDPRGDKSGFYATLFNDVTGELLIADSLRWYATIPAPSPAMPFALLALAAARRRRS